MSLVTAAVKDGSPAGRQDFPWEVDVLRGDQARGVGSVVHPRLVLTGEWRSALAQWHAIPALPAAFRLPPST